MQGLDYRLNEFLLPTDQRGLLIDTSAGMVLGALAGLEDFAAGVRPLLPIADGIVCGPGQLRRLAGAQMQDAGLLVRMDWTNTLRGPDFVLPPEHPTRFPIFSAQDALDFGAVGMVITFLLGYEEDVEAGCLKNTVTLALEGKAVGLPLVVEVRPTGPRVSLPAKAVELGASYALEGGADVIVVPYPGRAPLQTIAEMLSVPWLIKPTHLDHAAGELDVALGLGASGIWLDHQLFAHSDPTGTAQSMRQQLHGQPGLPEGR